MAYQPLLLPARAAKNGRWRRSRRGGSRKTKRTWRGPGCARRSSLPRARPSIRRDLRWGRSGTAERGGEMPAQTQAKLLRVLEDRKVRRLGSKSETPVDVRVLAATNKEPEQAVSSGQLRQDLYFRLNVFHIHLPPLREHKDDIPLLVDHILRDVNAKHGKHVRGIGAEVLDIFMRHPCPGKLPDLPTHLN